MARPAFLLPAFLLTAVLSGPALAQTSITVTSRNLNGDCPRFLITGVTVDRPGSTVVTLAYDVAGQGSPSFARFDVEVTLTPGGGPYRASVPWRGAGTGTVNVTFPRGVPTPQGTLASVWGNCQGRLRDTGRGF